MATKCYCWPKPPKGLCLRGRRFTQRELVAIRKLIRDNPSWGRTRLSEEVCERFGWFQENTRLKDRACRVALLKMEKMSLLTLPPRRTPTGGARPTERSYISMREAPLPVVTMPAELRIELVTSTKQAETWNALVSSYHYLGLPTPVGRLVRYLFYAQHVPLGAASFTEPAWSIRARTHALDAIGLHGSDPRRIAISNNRFIILPTVRVKNLASTLLSKFTRLAAAEWEHRYSVRPLVAETFVDPTRFTGACFRAANWIVVGTSRGYAKRGGSHHNSQTQKLLLLRGLRPRIQHRLQQHFAKGSSSD